MSIKFQLTLPDELAERLREASDKLGVPLAQLIRETMEERLRQRKPTSTSNPLAAITGLVDTEERDLASRVDEILYQR